MIHFLILPPDSAIFFTQTTVSHLPALSGHALLLVTHDFHNWRALPCFYIVLLPILHWCPCLGDTEKQKNREKFLRGSKKKREVGALTRNTKKGANIARPPGRHCAKICLSLTRKVAFLFSVWCFFFSRNNFSVHFSIPFCSIGGGYLKETTQFVESGAVERREEMGEEMGVDTGGGVGGGVGIIRQKTLEGYLDDGLK